MNKAIIGWIDDKRMITIEEDFQSLFVDEPEIQPRGIYSFIILIDDNLNVVGNCYIPKPQLQDLLPPESTSNYSWQASGYELQMEIGNMLTSEEYKTFREYIIPFIVFELNSKYFYITTFSLICDQRNPSGRKFYEKLFKKRDKMSIQLSKGSSNYIEGGYDIDGAFGGETGAYWNID